MFDLNSEETKIFKKLRSPAKIQDFLEKLRANFAKDTCYSPRLVLKHKKADCIEGAIFAAAALRFHGHKPLILDLKAAKHDLDHVVAVFKIRGAWGAITKTNHAVLRFREPIYKSIRELVISYFHEYFLNNGQKTLRSYSQPVDLSRFDKRNWMTSEKDLWYIHDYLDQVPHKQILTKAMLKNLRRADPIEIQAGKLVEWKRKSG